MASLPWAVGQRPSRGRRQTECGSWGEPGRPRDVVVRPWSDWLLSAVTGAGPFRGRRN
jgi:hypothetical protein